MRWVLVVCLLLISCKTEEDFNKEHSLNLEECYEAPEIYCRYSTINECPCTFIFLRDITEVALEAIRLAKEHKDN